MLRRSSYITFLLVCICFILTSCGRDSDHKELKRYVNSVKSRRSTQIEPIPEVKVNRKYAYPNKKRRSPFEPAAKHTKKSSQGPDQQRPKQPLENYMLDSLKMVGILEREGEKWAIIAAPDGMFYRVNSGKYIGQNYGKVAKINNKEVVLEETVQVNGVWEKRSAKLSLVEGNG